MKTINITCKGQKYINIKKLKNFQGNLKKLDADAENKLKNSIIKYGFSFPVFVWKDNILDGHQRVFATLELLKAGYEVDKIPVVEIDAENKTEAAEKLLMLNSKYGEITDDGLHEFLASNEIDIASMAGELNLTEIDMDAFFGPPDFEPAAEDDQGKLDELDPKMITCPHCGEDFDTRKA